LSITVSTGYITRIMSKASGRSGKAKKPNAPIAPGEDDSYIIFGDGNPKRKTKAPESGSSSGNIRTTGGQAVGEDAPKKPDTRKLIGGASWTGKLPVNLLSEHCQKQRWAKPEYTMVW